MRSFSFLSTLATLALMLASARADPTAIAFQSCADFGPKPLGTVHSVSIDPCERGAENEPCRFRFHQNYTISISYTSTLNATRPDSGLIARDDTTSPSEYYPYSGQSFSACKYTACPIQPDVPSVYTYEFQTLKSPFDNLTVNVTSEIGGPSLFCASFDAFYMPSSGKSKAAAEAINGKQK